ncbi:MAG: hypothetical protein GF353_24840 [Candidatus Lokiarchaeota archaeon]|nr:hypothetical protein [Candidatus Lokiarchaeota archaeon]
MSDNSQKNQEDEEKNAEITINGEISTSKKIEETKTKIGKPIIIKAEAYKTIILYASRYANKVIPPKDWKEIYGILVGYANDDVVYVERAEPLAFGHATDVQLDERHYGFIEEIQEKLDQETTKPNYYIIGWFHSHPGLGLFFSYIDIINQLGFQAKNNDACGLVFDHTLLGKKRQETIEGTQNTITKYETGFEIYRLTDVNMDPNSPKFDTNYHKVDYIVDGLNKFFFANVLRELTELVTEGKPLQSAYREKEDQNNEMSVDTSSHISETSNEPTSSELSHPNINTNTIAEKDLVEIPLSEDIVFDVDDFFYGKKKSGQQKHENKKEKAEELIFEGNRAFQQNDSFAGIEKYRQGIKKLKKIGEYVRVLQLLRNLIEHCVRTKHFNLAREFNAEMSDLAKKELFSFYVAEAIYLKGYIMLKEGDNELLEDGLKLIQQASIKYEEAEDFAGAGRCYHKIGVIYHSRLNQAFNACLFYLHGIMNYNKAITRGFPSRTDLWSKPESLSQKIVELKDIVEELMVNIKNPEERKKVQDDLESLKFSF